MRTLQRLGLIVSISLGVSACASGPNIRSDYDQNADFAAYRTFGFMSPLGTDRSGYQTLVTERLKTAARVQMEQKGYVYDPEAPNLLVNFQVQVRERTEYVPPPPMPWGANYYGYRMGWYGAWPGYGFGPDLIQYTEGVLNVDLIDVTKKQMVWEGIATSVIDSPQQAQSAAYIDPLMAQIFARYPFLAGSSTPRSMK